MVVAPANGNPFTGSTQKGAYHLAVGLSVSQTPGTVCGRNLSGRNVEASSQGEPLKPKEQEKLEELERKLQEWEGNNAISALTTEKDAATVCTKSILEITAWYREIKKYIYSDLYVIHRNCNNAPLLLVMIAQLKAASLYTADLSAFRGKRECKQILELSKQVKKSIDWCWMELGWKAKLMNAENAGDYVQQLSSLLVDCPKYPTELGNEAKNYLVGQLWRSSKALASDKTHGISNTYTMLYVLQACGASPEQIETVMSNLPMNKLAEQVTSASTYDTLLSFCKTIKLAHSFTRPTKQGREYLKDKLNEALTEEWLLAQTLEVYDIGKRNRPDFALKKYNELTEAVKLCCGSTMKLPDLKKKPVEIAFFASRMAREYSQSIETRSWVTVYQEKYKDGVSDISWEQLQKLSTGQKNALLRANTEPVSSSMKLSPLYPKYNAKVAILIAGLANDDLQVMSHFDVNNLNDKNKQSLRNHLAGVNWPNVAQTYCEQNGITIQGGDMANLKSPDEVREYLKGTSQAIPVKVSQFLSQVQDLMNKMTVTKKVPCFDVDTGDQGATAEPSAPEDESQNVASDLYPSDLPPAYEAVVSS